MKIMRAMVLICAASTMLVFAGCGSSDSEDHGKGDGGACVGGLASNNIESMDPKDGATGFGVASPIRITFACALDETTINDSSVTVSWDDVVVEGTLSYEAATKTLIFTPKLPLYSGMTYDIKISGLLLTTEAPKSVEKMAGDVTKRFTAHMTPLIYSSTLDPADPGTPTQRNIWTMNADGTSKARLTSYSGTSDNASAFKNAWSPDDKHIAYILSKSLSGIYYYFLISMGPDGAGQTVVTGNGTFFTDPSSQEASLQLSFDWAPDGSELYFIYKPDGADKFDIYSAKPDGTEKTRITDIPADTADDEYVLRSLKVSPDGSKLLYYLSHRDNLNMTTSSALYLMNSDGSSAQDLTTTFFSNKGVSLSLTTFSPDGKRIYTYAQPESASYNLFVYDIPSGKGWQQITDLGTKDTIKDYDVSLKGSLIAYVVFDGNLIAYHIYTLYTDGYATSKLTNATPAADPAAISNVVISPDGSRIAYAYNSDVNLIGAPIDIYTISANNGDNTKISDGTVYLTKYNQTFLFSPDGSSVAYNYYLGDPKTGISNIAVDSMKLTDSTKIESSLADWW